MFRIHHSLKKFRLFPTSCNHNLRCRFQPSECSSSCICSRIVLLVQVVLSVVGKYQPSRQESHLSPVYPASESQVHFPVLSQCAELLIVPDKLQSQSKYQKHYDSTQKTTYLDFENTKLFRDNYFHMNWFLYSNKNPGRSRRIQGRSIL